MLERFQAAIWAWLFECPRRTQEQLSGRKATSFRPVETHWELLRSLPVWGGFDWYGLVVSKKKLCECRNAESALSPRLCLHSFAVQSREITYLQYFGVRARYLGSTWLYFACT